MPVQLQKVNESQRCHFASIDGHFEKRIKISRRCDSAMISSEEPVPGLVHIKHLHSDVAIYLWVLLNSSVRGRVSRRVRVRTSVYLLTSLFKPRPVAASRSTLVCAYGTTRPVSIYLNIDTGVKLGTRGEARTRTELFRMHL